MSRKIHKTINALLFACLMLFVLFLLWQWHSTQRSDTPRILRLKNATKGNKEEKVTNAKTYSKHETPVVQKHDGSDITETLTFEQWIRPFSVEDTEGEMEGKFRQISSALETEFYLYILAKYATWTDGEIRQRFRELREQAPAIRTEAFLQEESELSILPRARRMEQSRTNPPPDWEVARDMLSHRSSFYTEEVRDFAWIRSGRCSGDGDIEAINKIVARLNQAISSNKTILTYWDDLIESWGLPPQQFK